VTKPIIQSVTFARTHRSFTDLSRPQTPRGFHRGKVKISAKPAAVFRVRRMLAGTMLWTIPEQMIVQRWRSTASTKAIRIPS